MKQFPIMVGHEGTKGPCPSSIPWDAIAPYEGQAQVNHDQSLEKLASRGGLDPIEAFFIMTGRVWHNVRTPVSEELEREASAFIDKVVKDWATNELRAEVERKGVALRGAVEACDKWRRRAVDAECQASELTTRLEKEKDQYDDLEKIAHEEKGVLERQVKELKEQVELLEAQSRIKAKRERGYDTVCGTCNKHVDRRSGHKCFHCNLYICPDCGVIHFGDKHDTGNGGKS